MTLFFMMNEEVEACLGINLDIFCSENWTE